MSAQGPSDPLAAVDRLIAAAEGSVRAAEMETAESHYRSALFGGLMISGALHVAAGRLEEAENAFREASRAVVDADAALRSLAAVQLQRGERADAIQLLTRLAGRAPRDFQTRRLLAQALVANGQPGEAVQTLEEARAAAPGDPEIAFLLASGYVRLKKIDAAEGLFAEVTAARPIPQTWVLIGRTYRDAGLYDRARAALATALKKDARTRRANYYLGTVALMEEGTVRLEEAIAAFRRELKLVPDDTAANLRLGMALVESRRPAEALPPLRMAAKKAASSVEAWLYFGRAQLGVNQAGDAAASLQRALELATKAAGEESQIRNIHYQLGLALRETGATAEAATHFEQARDASARRADAERKELGRYLAAEGDAGADSVPFAMDSPYGALAEADRGPIERRIRTTLARVYHNLGVMRAQARRFDRAAEFFERAAAIDPEFPLVQYSLGVARFNAEQFDRAAPPLERALAAAPENADVRRMLALARFNAGEYGRAAELLETDSRRESDPSLQYAYGLALVRSGQGARAEMVFSRLLAANAGVPQLHVIIGQAHAQQGDYGAAVQSLEKAIQLEPDVADAHAALGLIYLKQGKLPEAATALRAELQSNPGNYTARHTLATVLDLEGQTAEAIDLLKNVIRQKPDFGDARYLLGKILLTGNDAEQAVEHLEMAVRLSPGDATYHYQLAQAYTKLGRRELAEQHFARYRELKDKVRGGAS